MVNHSLAAIAAELGRARKPILAGHVLPDGDSIGSTLALGMMLEQLGATVTMVSQDQIPATYRFLPGVERIHIGAIPDGPFDYLVTLDCSVPERVGKVVEPLLSRPDVRVINIDHHPALTLSAGWADYDYIDPTAAAVGEIIFDLIEFLGVRLTPDISVCLYTAIITDTGSFRYENTSAETHRRAAQLIEAGSQVGAVNTQIYAEKPVAAIKLLHRALGTLATSTCGRIAWLKLTRAMEEECAADQVDAEGIINYARMIHGVEVGILFREMPEGQLKVSFRSKRLVDVSLLASRFGGGGHPRAAGCKFDEQLAEVEPLVIKVVEQVIAEVFDGRDT
jgi:phosphoesterase RecJ-like protein